MHFYIISLYLFIILGRMSHVTLKFLYNRGRGRYMRVYSRFHFFPILCSRVGSACTSYPHLDEEGHLEYPDILQHTRAFRHRRKLRMTDRHQRGILRGGSHSQQLFCAVPGVQDPLVPRSLTVHYYDGNYGAIIRINRDAHRNKPQTVLLRIARRNRDYSLRVATTLLCFDRSVF